MKTFKEYLEEHCKTGPYYKPFNMLQVKILKSLYFGHLKDNVEGFNDSNIKDNSDLVVMILDIIPNTLQKLGGVICNSIPDEKTLRYTGTDIKRWADELYKMINKEIK